MLNAAAMCSAGNVVTNVSAVKLTYSDIQRLSTASLNKHCRSFNIDTSLPKSAKINAVCHCCDATTAGDWRIADFVIDNTSSYCRVIKQVSVIGTAVTDPQSIIL